MNIKDDLKTRFVFCFKELTLKKKDQFLFEMMNGSELIEIDEAIYTYCEKVFRPLILAELRDLFVLNLRQSGENHQHLIEFFQQGGRYFVKPAACSIDEAVEGLPNFHKDRYRASSSMRMTLRSRFQFVPLEN